MTMQAIEPTPARFTNPVSRYFAATRPPFLSATLVAALLGLASAVHGGLQLQLNFALVTLLFAVVAHAGVNVLNDYYDALNGTDDRNTGRIFPFTGGSRFIQNGVLTAAQMRNYGFVLMALVMLAGLWLMVQATPLLLYVGLAGLFIGWAYSAPPFKLNSRGWGEFCVVAGILSVTVGADLVQRHVFSLAPFLIGLPYALLTANLLYINQFPDREADAAAGKLHWVARLEVKQARWGYVLIVATSYLLIAFACWYGYLPAMAMLAWLALPLSAQASRLLWRHADQAQRLAGAIQLTIGAMLLQGVLLSLVLFLTKGNS